MQRIKKHIWISYILRSTIILCTLFTHFLQNLSQRVAAACVAADDLCIALFCLCHRTFHHLMGNRIGEQDQKIRTADLVTHLCRHLCENLRLALILFANLLILTDHTVMSANNYYAHKDSFPASQYPGHPGSGHITKETPRSPL